MTNISRHPLLAQAYEVCQEIEKCGASPQLTAAVTKASALLHELDAFIPVSVAQTSGMTPFSWRKKPVVIEAFQWTGDKDQLGEPEWIVEAIKTGVVGIDAEGLNIVTLEGVLTASHGDWIIRGVKGELYPCKPDIFAATYEPADAAPDNDEDRLIAKLQALGEDYGCPGGVNRFAWLRTRLDALARLEKATSPVNQDGADFSDALVWLKNGEHVRRTGWNGKGLWLEYIEPYTSVDLPFIRLVYPVPGNGSLPYPNGARVPWAPSQTDMLATDWQLVD